MYSNTTHVAAKDLRIACAVRGVTPFPVAMGDLLVVDDEDSVRRFLATALGDEGHVVVTAPDGIEALARLKERSFHVVLADLTMPRMDGITLLKPSGANIRRWRSSCSPAMDWWRARSRP